MGHHENIKGFVLVASDDLTTIQPLLAGLALATLHWTDDQPHIQLSGHRVTPEQMYVWCIGAMAHSATGKKNLEKAWQVFSMHLGGVLPDILSIETPPASKSKDSRAQALLLLVQRLTQAHNNAAARNVALMREAAQLRQFQSETQDAFSRLEQFVYAQALMHRSPARIHLPASGLSPITLLEHNTIEQRLPAGSAGLCDVALHLFQRKGEPMPLEGTLAVELTTIEDGKTQAVWLVKASDLKPGWLRLSLPASLSADEKTPTLRVTWDGHEPCLFSRSMPHPDTRFQAAVDGQACGHLLAMQTWHYVPGAEAPMPAEAHAPHHSPVLRRVISPTALEAAVNLQTANNYFNFVKKRSALMVHVLNSGVASALLPEALPAGTCSVRSRIQTLSDKAPVVEYALALAPKNLRIQPDAPLPDFGTQHASTWHPLEAIENGEIHLELPRPLAEAHDLYLMTRLPSGLKSNAFGQSTFFNIRLNIAGGAMQ